MRWGAAASWVLGGAVGLLLLTPFFGGAFRRRFDLWVWGLSCDCFVGGGARFTLGEVTTVAAIASVAVLLVTALTVDRARAFVLPALVVGAVGVVRPFQSTLGDNENGLVHAGHALRNFEAGAWMSGEELAHLAYGIPLAVAPGLGPTRVALGWGFLGLVALVVLGRQLAGIDRQADLRIPSTVAMLAAPFSALYLGYPESTTLLSVLVPVFLVTGVRALRTGRTRHAGWAGAALGLAVCTHGAAWFLGLGASVLVLALWRQSGEAGMRFVGAFGLVWLSIMGLLKLFPRWGVPAGPQGRTA